MSVEITVMLQSILNSLSNPAYIEQNGKIILSNDLYSNHHYDEQEIVINKNPLHKDYKLCELIESDIYKLNHSREKLAQAVALL
jgi:hypothetical protein